MRGELFESLIISELLKQQYNLEKQPSLYFWRDQGQHEIDCIIHEADYQIPVEIKAGKTVSRDFFKQFDYWKTISDNPESQQYLVYGGSEDHSWKDVKVLGWQSARNLIKKISYK